MNLDVIVSGGEVVDGSTKPAIKCDIGIKGDRILAIGDLSKAEAGEKIDAGGLVVAPGFIDIHTHSDFSLLVNGAAESQVRQGVTLEVIGNCGHSAAPLAMSDHDLSSVPGYQSDVDILIFAVVVLDFFLIQAAPGDVVDVIVTEAGGGNPEIAEQIRASYGLDKPLHVQLLKYLAKMLTGDLGYSYYYDQSVTSLLLGHLPSTLILTLSALVIAVITGTLLGVIAATRPRGISSHIVTLFSLLGYATPVVLAGDDGPAAFFLLHSNISGFWRSLHTHSRGHVCKGPRCASPYDPADCNPGRFAAGLYFFRCGFGGNRLQFTRRRPPVV